MTTRVLSFEGGFGVVTWVVRRSHYRVTRKATP
jgi:hypothetical protein